MPFDTLYNSVYLLVQKGAYPIDTVLDPALHRRYQIPLLRQLNGDSRLTAELSIFLKKQT